MKHEVAAFRATRSAPGYVPLRSPSESISAQRRSIETECAPPAHSPGARRLRRVFCRPPIAIVSSEAACCPSAGSRTISGQFRAGGDRDMVESVVFSSRFFVAITLLAGVAHAEELRLSWVAEEGCASREGIEAGLESVLGRAISELSSTWAKV